MKKTSAVSASNSFIRYYSTKLTSWCSFPYFQPTAERVTTWIFPSTLRCNEATSDKVHMVDSPEIMPILLDTTEREGLGSQALNCAWQSYVTVLLSDAQGLGEESNGTSTADGEKRHRTRFRSSSVTEIHQLVLGRWGWNKVVWNGQRIIFLTSSGTSKLKHELQKKNVHSMTNEKTKMARHRTQVKIILVC